MLLLLLLSSSFVRYRCLSGQILLILGTSKEQSLILNTLRVIELSTDEDWSSGRSGGDELLLIPLLSISVM